MNYANEPNSNAFPNHSNSTAFSSNQQLWWVTHRITLYASRVRLGSATAFANDGTLLGRSSLLQTLSTFVCPLRVRSCAGVIKCWGTVRMGIPRPHIPGKMGTPS